MLDSLLGNHDRCAAAVVCHMHGAPTLSDWTGWERRVPRGRMCSDLSARLENIRRLRALWRSGDIKGTLEALSTIDDHGAAVDILSIVWSKSNIFSLDICVSLLPLLKELLGSPHDEYVITAMQVLQIILQSFGPLISQTRLASANQSFVDIQVSLYTVCCTHRLTHAGRSSDIGAWKAMQCIKGALLTLLCHNRWFRADGGANPKM